MMFHFRCFSVQIAFHTFAWCKNVIVARTIVSLQFRSVELSSCNRERKRADTIGTVLVSWFSNAKVLSFK